MKSSSSSSIYGSHSLHPPTNVGTGVWVGVWSDHCIAMRFRSNCRKRFLLSLSLGLLLLLLLFYCSFFFFFVISIHMMFILNSGLKPSSLQLVCLMKFSHFMFQMKCQMNCSQCCWDMAIFAFVCCINTNHVMAAIQRSERKWFACLNVDQPEMVTGFMFSFCIEDILFSVCSMNFDVLPFFLPHHNIFTLCYFKSWTITNPIAFILINFHWFCSHSLTHVCMKNSVWIERICMHSYEWNEDREFTI